MNSYPLLPPPPPPRSPLDLAGGGHGITSHNSFLPSEFPIDKPAVVELAVAAMEELTRMAHAGEPLWVPALDNGQEILNVDEYFRAFPRGIGPRPIGFKTEATRHSAIVIMNNVNLVEFLMDVVCLL